MVLYYIFYAPPGNFCLCIILGVFSFTLSCMFTILLLDSSIILTSCSSWVWHLLIILPWRICQILFVELCWIAHGVWIIIEIGVLFEFCGKNGFYSCFSRKSIFYGLHHKFQPTFCALCFHYQLYLTTFQCYLDLSCTYSTQIGTYSAKLKP